MTLFLQLLIFLLFLFKSFNNYIIIPFKLTNKEIYLNGSSIDNIDQFIKEINKNKPYSKISFGTPEKDLEIYYTMEKTSSAILSNYCLKGTNTSYIPSLSSSYRNSTPYNIRVWSIVNASLSQDIFLLYNNLQLTNKTKIENFDFLVGLLNEIDEDYIEYGKYCGMLGLLMKSYEGYLFNENFVRHLKKEKIIDTYNWGMFFFDKEGSYKVNNDIKNEYDGFYILGFYEQKYTEIFKASNVFNTYAIENIAFKGIGINFDTIYFYDSPNNITKYICSNNTLVELCIDNNYFLSNSAYYNKIKEIFFKKFLDEDICYEVNSTKSNGEKYYMIYCDLEFEKYINSFPNLYFFNRELSFIFNFGYKDVFAKINDKIYFLIIGKDAIGSFWKLGKIFFEKYPIIINQDKKTISLVYLDKYGNQDNSDNKEQNQKQYKEVLLYSIFGVCILAALIIGYIFGRKLWKKNRKIKANELDENIEYFTDERYSKINND